MTKSRWLIGIMALCLAVSPALAPAESFASSQNQLQAKAKAKEQAKKPHQKSHRVKKSAGQHARKGKGKVTASRGDSFSALVVDADTNHVLYEKNAAGIRYPASLTKMMTLYLTFDALKKGKLTLDQELPVSAKAASQPQTNISLQKGDRIPLRTAIQSVVVRSANDSAMVLGEALGGTEWNFALMMTKKAHELGMKNTVFRNPSGLPDNQQFTTAYDMARLGIALRRDFPEYYPFFKMKSFVWNGITYPGHNHVMERYAGADGVKTGFIRASGYNLVTSAKRDGHSLVAVIMGGSTIASRDNQMISMLDRTFAQLEDNDKKVAAVQAAKKNEVQVSQAGSSEQPASRQSF